MTTATPTSPRTGARRADARRRWFVGLGDLDPVLLISSGVLLALGLVMVSSASIAVAARDFGNPWRFTLRQAVFMAVGIGVAWVLLQLPLARWRQLARPLLLASLALLLAVLVPGFGRTVNGSTRWLELGVIGFQVSEAVKLAVLIYLADYVVRQREAVRTRWSGFLNPLGLIGVAAGLLLLEPNFGAALVILTCALTVLFLAGVPLPRFALLVALAAGVLALLVLSSPYRLERVTAFLDPWAHPFNSGFQLTQSLIAIGSGGWTGAGLGQSVQKLFYLPEAHTDFLFAIFAEETGLVGVLVVLALYATLVGRAFDIARRAHARGLEFAGHLASGLGLWIALEAFINIGVNMGLLPTKGLTLPLLSYGGSSTLVMCATVGLLLRLHYEVAGAGRQARPRGAGR